MEKETKIINWEQEFFVHHRNVLAITRVEFFSEWMSYIVLRGRWCNIIVWNVHASGEEMIDDSDDSLCEELEQVFKFFLSATLLGDCNAKVGEREYFKTDYWE